MRQHKSVEYTQLYSSEQASTIHTPVPPLPWPTPSTSTRMEEGEQPIIRMIPNRPFKGHESTVTAGTVFPDGRRMATGSYDKTLRLWDLKDGVVVKKMEGHQGCVRAVAGSGDGQLIASGDKNGELIAWDGDTGECLTEAIKVHSDWLRSLDFSPDSKVLVTGSWDGTTKLWCTKTWKMQGNPMICGAAVNCVRYSPSGERVAIATHCDIQIWNPRTRKRIAKFKAANDWGWNSSLAWTPDGTRLLSGGSASDSTIREWDSSTWKQVGDPWRGHTDYISAIAVNPTGTLVASASSDNHVRLWRLWGQCIAIFMDSRSVSFVTFSADGRHVFSGGVDMKTSEWEVPALMVDAPKEQASGVSYYSMAELPSSHLAFSPARVMGSSRDS